MSLKDFQFLGKLGEGAFSSVYKVKRMIDNQIYAIKKVKLNNLSERQKQNALNEVRILASVNHPNVISYKESFIEQGSNYLYIIMEFADNGDLYQRINLHTKSNTKFSQEQIWSIAIQITRGLKALHDLKVLHRDLKSANVFLFKNGSVKLGDMNVSKMAKSMCKTQTGTPYYASPEVWKDLPYDKKSDIWSLGCVIYEAITLKPPFRANDMEGLFKKVTRGFYPHIPPEYTEELSLILKMLLQVTPHLRSTCDKILELPIVQKHYDCLPEHLQDFENKTDNKLLQTIKLKLDSKQQLSIAMPKPRYLGPSQIQAQKSNRKTTDLIEEMKDFHNISLKKQLEVEKDKLPKLHEDFSKNYDKREVPKDKVEEVNERSQRKKYTLDAQNSNSLVKKLLDPQNMAQDVNRLRKNVGKNYYQNSFGSERKLPLIYPGRLRSISPQNLQKILRKQKQKQRVYSIIGKY